MCRRTLPLERPCQSADLISERRTRRSARSKAMRRFWRRWKPATPRFRVRSSTQLDGAVLIGRKAVDAYVDGVTGRLMRSLKSVLGTSLIDETTRMGRQRAGFRDVIGYYLGAVKRRAEQATGRELRDVVHGRPVHFVDNDAGRRRARRSKPCARLRARSASMTSRSSSSRSPRRWTMSGRYVGGGRPDRRYRRRHVGFFDRASRAGTSRQG